MVPDVLGRPHPLKNIRDYSATEWCATGSVLGPVMFTLYTTPMQRIFKIHGIKYHKYADDIQLYASYNPARLGDQVETARRLTACIGEVRRWMVLHMLKLDDEKTKMMIFTSKHHLKTYRELLLDDRR